MNLHDIFEIYKENQIDVLIKTASGFNLKEKGLSYAKIQENWKILGNNPSNGSPVGILKSGEKGLLERITNAVDAVIEKQKNIQNMVSPKTSGSIIKKAFPKFYENISNIKDGISDQLSVKDANEQVVVAVNDGSKSNKPTFDVIDKGTGISGEDFANTILSINHGNKLSKDKSYLIGAFGQGGSTSLPFTYATMIISKINDKYYFTVIKAVELDDYKNIVYVYLTKNGEIIKLDGDNDFDFPDYINNFIDSDSGTFIRMIETDISKRYRDNEVTKPGMLGDYINTELFNVGLPIKIIDNRLNYINNEHKQNRYSYGSYLKLQTSKYLQKDYCGSISIIHNERSYKIDYFMLLPKDANAWGSESECKKVFEQFNVSYDPIIYVVNGQMINSESYIKLNNAGLNFLRYRLLVVIDLDVLDNEKYKFFTSDRSQIKSTDLTRGFIDKVIVALSGVDKLKEMNTIIAEKSINSSVDRTLLDDLSKDVKSEYSKYLKNGTLLPSTHGEGHHNGPTDEEIYEDEIKSLEITSSRRKFYKDQQICMIVTTHAQKHINEGAIICMFVDNSEYYDLMRNFMNGRISYTINAGKIKPGMHTMEFVYFKGPNNSLKTQKIVFEVINEKTPEEKSKEPEKDLDLDIQLVDEASLICNVVKEIVSKKITIYLCLDTDELRSEVYGLQRSADEISIIKTNIIKPIALFALFYNEFYDKIENDEDKNRLIITFIKAIIISSNRFDQNLNN